MQLLWDAGLESERIVVSEEEWLCPALLSHQSKTETDPKPAIYSNQPPALAPRLHEINFQSIHVACLTTFFLYLEQLTLPCLRYRISTKMKYN